MSRKRKMKRKRISYILTILIILTVITAALCVFLILRSRNSDGEQKDTEQERTEILQEESELEHPVEIETVSVESDDAVGELYRALELARRFRQEIGRASCRERVSNCV